MKRDSFIQSEHFSEMDCWDLQEALGHPGSAAAGIRGSREGTGATMAFADSKLSNEIRGEEVG
jgi:hypothetical protein